MGEKNNIKDITGLKVNKLTVISQTNKRHSGGSIIWLCKCDCGNYIEVPSFRLLSKKIYSCGCIINSKTERDKLRGKKYCSKCNKDLPLENFYFYKNNNIIYSICKECSREIKNKKKSKSDRPRKWRLDNKELYKKWKKRKAELKKARTRRRNLKKNRDLMKKNYEKNKDDIFNRAYKYFYGITLDDRNKIIEKQNGRCAICNEELDLEHNRRTHLDHCHETNIIRGILCIHCNLFIAKFNDDIILFRKVIHYIQYHENIKYSMLSYIKNPKYLAERRNILIDQQNNKCAICGIEMNDNITRHFTKPVLDHSYNTNRERSILCTKCNLGLGFIEKKKRTAFESISIINNAIEYISKYIN